ncbi:glucose-6-phosphate dehydrogenase [Cellulomonas fengjieae]|uniref:Glucose-6-phosphate 1-dehydrogenase n=1 Tax=Cellulomonas fengjieae TaxID=2819978 RepID=A0ABS3SHP7_9CELL|nr:glucose-6-phosphate dehydrogenase [Cellulomonas fengjieae]MBO3085276.1 glucose-6-phosphate dehydrogenase [Cellulomonas fengjieae]QVI66162.1 glucose-6-phosphate dehydrogenase [Cellulomonas fengjieae]
MAPTDPLIFVLHGARGDLAKRMVLPALATLQRRGLLPERWALLGTGRTPISSADFDVLLREAVEEFGDDEAAEGVPELTQHTAYCGDVSEDDSAAELPGELDRLREVLGGDVTVIHYLAVPPSSFAPITRALKEAGLTDGIRIVYEKPYGTSLESFRELDAIVHEVFDEEQVFRIDHFLGKEATQNLHVLRFANELFGGIWNRQHVEQVQIDVPETLDVAQRAQFYDATGAALDMLVTHLFQVAAEVAMEPPRRLDAANLGKAREDVIAHFRPLDPADDVVLGQFDGYRDIDDVPDDSTTDTFVAARLWVDTERWRGVPFLLRTGKRMGASAQQVTLVLRTPDELFGSPVGPNRVIVSLAGSGNLQVTTTVKKPGAFLELGTGTADLALADVEPGESLPPYAGLLEDVLVGDRTLFTTAAGLESAWKAFAPLLGPDRPAPEPYPADSWGPESAGRLAEPHGWVLGG